MQWQDSARFLDEDIDGTEGIFDRSCKIYPPCPNSNYFYIYISKFPVVDYRSRLDYD